VAETESKNRPAASGHRFGPDLSCSECGISWEEHQKDPVPCCIRDKADSLEADVETEAPALPPADLEG
jgi:hypothetical protein